MKYSMDADPLQDILPFVEQPSRYLGTEVNRVRKDHRDVKLKVVLAFPDLYEIGTSHLGLQILYSILNARKGIAAERVYAPDLDMERSLRASGTPLMSLETHTPVNRFDLVGFSLLYELNYTNILLMLELSGIPFLARERDESAPLIIGGGPCTCNPEPVADLFDALVIGDGETVICHMAQAWIEWSENGRRDKGALLESWSKLTGVYIPSFFEPKFSPAGFQSLLPKNPRNPKVTRAIVADLNDAPFPDAPIVPFGRPVHDRLRLEVARGCSRGCRYCQAGMIYRPVRERAPDRLLALAGRSLETTGYGDLSLLSLSTGDYTNLAPFLDRLMSRCEDQRIAVSLPSLRVETLTPHLMEMIKRVRKTGFTIAPEAGTQRLRNVINKRITDSDIHQTVEDAFRLGWRVIKLYFMIGLPTETEEDLKAIVELVRELRNRNRRRGQINASAAAFIPKPHTPFQWASQMGLSETKEKIDWIRSKLTLSGIHFKWQNPQMSILEGLWARGDRRLGKLLIEAFGRGCRFDGWSDHLRFDLWQSALSDTGIEIDFYTSRARELSEPLPWDHIDVRVDKPFLQSEWAKGLSGEETPDCRRDACSRCGVCDFTVIQPKINEYSSEKEDLGKADEPKSPEPFLRVKVSYRKEGQARYFGHLELKNIFHRAIRRAGIRVKYSEGFHPLPRVSFDDPLPVGMESENESLYLTVRGKVFPERIKTGLNEHLCEGLTVFACELVDKKKAHAVSPRATYRVVLKEGAFDPARIKEFTERPEWIIERSRRNGRIEKVDLKAALKGLTLRSPGGIELSLGAEGGTTLRPAEVLSNLFDLPQQAVKRAKIVKLNG